MVEQSRLAPGVVGLSSNAGARNDRVEACTRTEAYEFRDDVPAIDLLTGSTDLRQAIEAGKEPIDWIDSWAADERAFEDHRQASLLYS